LRRSLGLGLAGGLLLLSRQWGVPLLVSAGAQNQPPMGA
jgi:hypothetical protein